MHRPAFPGSALFFMSKQKNIKRRYVPTNSTIQGVPSFLNRIYAARGVTNSEQLDLSLKKLAHIDTLKGVESAVELIIKTINLNQKIVIVGDFDCDGATSTSLAVLVLRSLNVNCGFLVPNRFEYGYGLTPEIVNLAAQDNPDLIITVDNGISSIEGVTRAKELGIRVVITDHHLPGEVLPAADAIVNPNQPGCGFVSKSSAGVGVIFYVMTALRARLRELGWFKERGIPELNMAAFLDLLALGTVADLVPLDFNNRILVEQGLKRIRAGVCRPGIRALLEQAGRDLETVQASDMGFIVGPRLNAAGRLDDMTIGIQCLLTESLEEARIYAQRLDALNQERKQIEHEMKLEAEALLSSLETDSQHDQLASLRSNTVGICLYQPHWHQGVIGILASRIKEKLNRPTIIFAPESDDPQCEDPIIKGSARSIPGLHMRDALDLLAKKYPTILSKFGGHAMAAGMSIKLRDLEVFSNAFNEIAQKQLDEEALKAVIYTDGPLHSTELTIENIELLNRAGPWGQSFPEPSFDGEYRIIQSKILKERHLKLVLSDLQTGDLIDAIHFNSDWCQQVLPSKVRVVYRPTINSFRGKHSLQLFVDYMEAC